MRLLRDLRDEVLRKLADQIVADAAAQRSSGTSAGAS
jgi:hypothetical protein